MRPLHRLAPAGLPVLGRPVRTDIWTRGAYLAELPAKPSGS